MSGPDLNVVVVGPRGVVRDVVERMLAHHAVGVVVPASDEATADVAVLVDPTDADWSMGQQLGSRLLALRSTVDFAVLAEDIQRGADAVIDVDSASDDLGDAVLAVANGQCWFPASMAGRLVEAIRRGSAGAHQPILTAREHDILRHASDGLSVKQTARRLGIAPKTVENLQSRLFRKLDVRNRAQAVARAHAAGLLDMAASQPG